MLERADGIESSLQGKVYSQGGHNERQRRHFRVANGAAIDQASGMIRRVQISVGTASASLISQSAQLVAILVLLLAGANSFK